MKKYIFTVFAVAAVLSSCSKSLELNGDINSGAKAITTIGASTEISTRAVVSSDGTKVNWETGDQIGVLGTNVSSAAKNLPYTLDGDGGSTTGTFKNGESDITAISAVMYPYQATASWDGTNSKLTCEIPSVQTAVKGSFDKSAAVMYSIGNTTDANLNFAVNFLKVTIGVGDTDIHSITISSPSTELSGKIDITSSSVAAVSGQSLKSVTLTAGKNKVFVSGDYYIAIMPSDIVTPTISIIRYEDGHTAKEYAKTGSGNLEFTSGKNVKPISVTFSSVTSPTGHEAVQLWADGPYWATSNVGASAPEASGKHFAWGDVEGQTYDSSTSSWSGGGFSTAPTLDPVNPSILPLYYDAAAVNWNTAWRMPTGGESSGQFYDLINKTTYELVSNYNGTGVNGCKFSGKDDYSGIELFLPAAGIAYPTNFKQENGFYWASTIDPTDAGCAGDMYFLSNSRAVSYYTQRKYGLSVRPVSD